MNDVEPLDAQQYPTIRQKGEELGLGTLNHVLVLRASIERVKRGPPDNGAWARLRRLPPRRPHPRPLRSGNKRPPAIAPDFAESTLTCVFYNDASLIRSSLLSNRARAQASFLEVDIVNV